jgi:hypothetical protein
MFFQLCYVLFFQFHYVFAYYFCFFRFRTVLFSFQIWSSNSFLGLMLVVVCVGHMV